MSLNLADALEFSAARFAERPALHFEGRTFTYAELRAGVHRVAGLLHEKGIGRGDTVALLLPNVPQFAFCLYGALYTGATVSPFNVMLKPGEIAYQLADCGARVVFAFAPLAEGVAQAISTLAEPPALIVVEPGMSPEAPAHGESFLGLLFAADPVTQPVPTRPDDTAVILYTNASAGHPMGAELTHFNLHQNALTITQFVFQYHPEDVFLSALPLFHSFGLTTMLHAPLLAGASAVLVPRFDPGRVLESIAQYRITLAAMVPTMLHLLNHHRRDHEPDLSSLRAVISGGAALSRDIATTFGARFGMEVLEGYGLTETSPLVSFNNSYAINRPGTVGPPIWGCSVRIQRSDGSWAAPGDEGEVLVRGHNVMKGYLNRTEATAQYLKDGWLHTGDLGRLDQDGYLTLTGLKKDMYIRAGLNVYPREVERVLEGHPQVAEAAIIATHDPLRGDEGHAYVVLRDGAAPGDVDVCGYLRERIASYKVPRRATVVGELPRTPAGAVDKAALRAQHALGAECGGSGGRH